MKKRYYNETTKEWYTEGKSNTRRITNGLFAGVPSVERLTEWGFVEYVPPTPRPEEQLSRAKAAIIKEIERYDKSSAVNEFYLGGHPMWLTREERTQIGESIAAYEDDGKSQMIKYFNGVPYTFPLTKWKYMLNKLIVYASEALNVTEAHKAAVEAMTSIEYVEGYDYTTDYPAKLVF